MQRIHANHGMRIMTDASCSIKIYHQPVVVAGATGKQGGAVARRLLNRGHRVRALTRDPSKPSARALAEKGAEVVAADLEDPASLDKALRGSGAVFSVQDFLESGVEAEVRQGLNLIDAVAAAGVSHIVYSGASTIDRNTGVPHLDSKWRLEQRVRRLEVPWTVFRPAAFMDNWEWDRETIERDSVVTLPLRPDTPYSQVAVADIAAMVVMALERPDVWVGQIAPLAGDVSTPIEIAATFSRVMDRHIRYEQMPWEACHQAQGEELTLMYKYFDEFGMEGVPQFLQRWRPNALSLEAFLRSEGWDKTRALGA